MNDDVTVLIAARNAESTIVRAIRSAMKESPGEILLIDDFSEDSTVELAYSAADKRLRVVRPEEHGTLGFTRQTGLMEVKTPFTVLLDADDQFIEGRVKRLTDRLKKEEADFVSDGVELVDGNSGLSKGFHYIPSFLKPYRYQARLFERNYLPGSGFVGFRTDKAQCIGYDTELHGPEDFGFLLRAVAAGAAFTFIDHIGYRYYDTAHSVSRNINGQREMYKKALKKFDYEEVRNLYDEAGHDDRTALWGLTAMASYREEYEKGVEFLSELEAVTGGSSDILEPDGPYPVREDWRIDFQKGAFFLLLGFHEEGLPLLLRAERKHPTPEGANNVGVALAMSGDRGKAEKQFQTARNRLPHYLDAKLNLEETHNSFNITTHPLRLQPSRSEYSG